MQKETQDYVFCLVAIRVIIRSSVQNTIRNTIKILNFSRRGETFQKYVQTYPKIAIRMKTSFSDF